MKRRRRMKILMIIATLLACVVLLLIILTYPGFRREMRAARERLLADSQILKVDSGAIEYSVKGEGTPVLLLHGAGGGYDQGLWVGKVFLGDGYRFISVSRFGYLRSPIPQAASIWLQASLYADLLDHLGIERVVVVGASAGGPSAMQFANDYPDRISALILVSAVSMAEAPGDKAPFYVGLIHLIQRSDYVYWLFAKSAQPLICGLMGTPSEVYQGFGPEQRNLAQEMLDIMHPMSQRYQGTMNDGAMIQRDGVSATGISAPTLILHAKDDALVSCRHAENAHEKIGGSRLILFDAGGHAMLSQMAKATECTREFLRDVPRSSD